MTSSQELNPRGRPVSMFRSRRDIEDEDDEEEEVSNQQRIATTRGVEFENTGEEEEEEEELFLQLIKDRTCLAT